MFESSGSASQFEDLGWLLRVSHQSTPYMKRASARLALELQVNLSYLIGCVKSHC
jgi:hypothetical protein